MKRNRSITTAAVDMHEIEKQLFKRKGELEEQLAKLHKESLPAQHSRVMDIADQTQLVMQEILSISLHDKEFEEYKKILEALRRIKVGNYGLCEECGNAISPKRLAAYPDATRCIVCQELLEEGAEA